MKASTLLRLLLLSAAALMAGTLSAADALKIIVPTAPGGGTDGFFRVLAKEAEAALGEPIVIVNVPGAGGTIGVAQMCARPTTRPWPGSGSVRSPYRRTR